MSDSGESIWRGVLARSSERGQSPLEAEVVALFDELREPLLRYLHGFRALAAQDYEEIVQEVFLALFQHLQRGKSREDKARDNLRAWLFRVAHNLALKRVQKARREGAMPESAGDEIACPTVDPEQALAEAQTQERIYAVVRALPEVDRRCLALRAEGLRYREIAEVLGISLSGVAKSIERSIARVARATER